MIYFYNVILFLFIIPAFVYFLAGSIRNTRQGIFFKFKERLGIWDAPEDIKGKKILWFHGASLGEVRALEPLIRKFTGFTTIITVLTPSARAYAEKNRIADHVFIAPLDFLPLVKNALRVINPAALILFETEIWPSLILEAKKQGVRTILINGRISVNSYPLYKAAGFFLKKVINAVDILCVRSKEDSARFEGLGYKNGITVTGNIKYDRDSNPSEFSRHQLKLGDSDLIFVAGSTREKEEEILLEAFRLLREKFPRFKMVIAPRHLKRVGEIVALIKARGLASSLYSSGAVAPFNCLILDTFGDLVKFYSAADITFVGGSLVNRGGQNPIEPASCGKPVLFGPYMQNFETEAQVLKDFGGGFSVKNGPDLADKIEKLFDNRPLLAETGKKALEAVMSQKGALNKTKEIIISSIS